LGRINGDAKEVNSSGSSSSNSHFKPDRQIIQEVANWLGANWNHRHPSEIMREIAPLTPLVAGVTFCLTNRYRTFNGRD